MNYLAHLFLAGSSDEFRAGALAGDFVRGILPSATGDGYVEGIRHHRAIDAYTDSHPVSARSRARIPQYRHYARIIVDVFYDHLLARTWNCWTDIPLPRFTRSVYGSLLRMKEQMPPEMRIVVERMSEGDWLSGYGEIDSVRRALRGISTRIQRPVRLEESVSGLLEQYAAFEADFLEFFPGAIHMSERWKNDAGDRSV